MTTENSHDTKGVFVSWDEKKATTRGSQCPFYEVVSLATIDLVTSSTSRWTSLPLTDRIGFPLQYKTVDDRAWPQNQQNPPENRTLSLLMVDVRALVNRMFLQNGYCHAVFSRCDDIDLSIKDLKAVESFIDGLVIRDEANGGLPRLPVEPPKSGPLQFSADGIARMPAPKLKVDTKTAKAAYDKAFSLFDPGVFAEFRASYVEEKVPLRPVCGGCSKKEREGPDGSDLRACSKCKSTKYCSKECQASAWPRHKKLCKPPLEIGKRYHVDENGIRPMKV